MAQEINGDNLTVRSKMVECLKKGIPFIFKQMAGMDVVFNDEMTKKVEYAVFTLRYRLAYDVTGLISIHGQVRGYVGLHLGKSLIFKAASTLLRREVTEIGVEVKDASGKFGNAVTENLRTEMDKQGIKFDLGMPLVLCGVNVASSIKPPLISSLCVFTAPDGNGCVELAIDAPLG